MEKDEIVFGIHSVEETLLSDRDIDKIFIQKDAGGEQIKKLIHAAREQNVPMIRAPKEKLNRLTRKNHQGVVAIVSAIHYASLDHVIQSCYEKGDDPFLVVLDGVTDVRNFGAIARTAECAGIHGLVIPTKGSAQITSDAIKTSSGALNHLPVSRTFDLVKTLKYLKETGISVVGCTEKGAKNLYGLDLTGPIAIVMGSEEKGLSPETMKVCVELGFLPMHGKIGSLNVSVAAAVLMYEVVRQKSL